MLTTPRSTAKEAVRGTKHAACAAGAEHWSAMDASQACMYPECLHVAGLLNPPTISWREVSGRRHLHHRQLRRRQDLPTGSQLAELVEPEGDVVSYCIWFVADYVILQSGFLSSHDNNLYFIMILRSVLHFAFILILEHNWCLSPALTGHPCGITLRGV
jgi:hypothetical protein